MTSARQDAEACFPRDIAQHRMTVIRDDGVYRHLRFSRPGTNNMSFDILTWPGYLAYVGDMGDYVFQRLEDMFEFFRHDKINPSYWGEKVQASCRDGVKEYSEDLARDWVAECLKDAGAEAKDEAEDFTYDEGEHEMYRQLHEARNDAFMGWQEANFQDYTYRYVWCCCALVWAIKTYDASKVR